jgi:predicted aspartyl protease
VAVSTPRLVSNRFPYLPVHLEVRRGVHDVEALLDTGFDGDVSLPPAMISNGGQPDGHQRWILADGSTVLAPYYLGTLRIGTIEVPGILVTAVGDEPLLGRGILTDVTVTLDHGRRVIVEP